MDGNRSEGGPARRDENRTDGISSKPALHEITDGGSRSIKRGPSTASRTTLPTRASRKARTM